MFGRDVQNTDKHSDNHEGRKRSANRGYGSQSLSERGAGEQRPQHQSTSALPTRERKKTSKRNRNAAGAVGQDKIMVFHEDDEGFVTRLESFEPNTPVPAPDDDLCITVDREDDFGLTQSTDEYAYAKDSGTRMDNSKQSIRLNSQTHWERSDDHRFEDHMDWRNMPEVDPSDSISQVPEPLDHTDNQWGPNSIQGLDRFGQLSVRSASHEHGTASTGRRHDLVDYANRRQHHRSGRNDDVDRHRSRSQTRPGSKNAPWPVGTEAIDWAERQPRRKNDVPMGLGRDPYGQHPQSKKGNGR